MVKNKKILETMYECTKRRGECRGCFYGDGEDSPNCIFNLMNDVLFFFGNPVPSDSARVLTEDELRDALSDRKDHIAFCEFISSIHVCKPVIRSISLSNNVVTMFDPNTGEKDQFTLSEYYTSFRVWSTKPTDKLRNATDWIPLDGHTADENDAESVTKTTAIMRFAHNMTQNMSND